MIPSNIPLSSYSGHRAIIHRYLYVIIPIVNALRPSRLIKHPLPITAPAQQVGELLEVLLVHLIEAIQNSAVDIDNGNHLLLASVRARQDGDYNLALAVSVAGDMPWEFLHILHQLRRLGLRNCSTDSTPKRDCLAGHLALKGPEDELGLA